MESTMPIFQKKIDKAKTNPYKDAVERKRIIEEHIQNGGSLRELEEKYGFKFAQPL